MDTEKYINMKSQLDQQWLPMYGRSKNPGIVQPTRPEVSAGLQYTLESWRSVFWCQWRIGLASEGESKQTKRKSWWFLETLGKRILPREGLRQISQCLFNSSYQRSLSYFSLTWLCQKKEKKKTNAEGIHFPHSLMSGPSLCGRKLNTYDRFSTFFDWLTKCILKKMKRSIFVTVKKT